MQYEEIKSQTLEEKLQYIKNNPLKLSLDQKILKKTFDTKGVTANDLRMIETKLENQMEKQIESKFALFNEEQTDKLQLLSDTQNTLTNDLDIINSTIKKAQDFVNEALNTLSDEDLNARSMLEKIAEKVFDNTVDSSADQNFIVIDEALIDERRADEVEKNCIALDERGMAKSIKVSCFPNFENERYNGLDELAIGYRGCESIGSYIKNDFLLYLNAEELGVYCQNTGCAIGDYLECY